MRRRDARDPERPVHQRTSRTPRSGSTITSHPTDTTCPPNPPRRIQPAERVAQRRPASRRAAAPATSSTASTTSSTSSMAATQDRYVTGSDAMGLSMGVLRHQGPADLQVPAQRRTPGLRDRGQLLPGGVRWIVPQSPVAHRGRLAGRSGGRTGGANADAPPGPRRQRDAARTSPSTRRPSADRDAAVDPARPGADRDLRPGRDPGAAAERARLRQLRRQHDAARLPAVGPVRGQAAGTDRPDHRRPPDRRRCRLGLVLGRLGQRQRQHVGPGLYQRLVARRPRRPGAATRTSIRASSHWPECPDNLFQYHHQPFNYFANFSTATPAGRRPGRAPPGRSRVRAGWPARRTRACNLKPVSFVKPIGEENEHPGYASEPDGSDHLVDLL